ncbi:hypothetical protein KNN17_12355, partial [Arthrobacter bambusae]|nr:hypothetical protein [Arthrobacter bambusae]
GTATTSPGTRHVLDIRTPTGHHYRSTARPLPGTESSATVPPHSKHHRRLLRHQAKALKYAHVTELRVA